MRRRAEFSFVTHWREQYATGRLTLDQFEVLIDAALRAERLPRHSTVARSSRASVEQWHEITAAKAANYAAGVSAGRWASTA